MPDAPETPAPLFAIRAFKSALFGTPAAEDEGEEERTLELKDQKDGHQLTTSDSLNPSAWNSKETANTRKDDSSTTANGNASPTKSILLTPGTASNRRKTVSFGDGVVDNDVVPAGQDLGEARPGVAVLEPAVADELDQVVGNAVGNGRPLVAIWVSHTPPTGMRGMSWNV